MQKGYTLVEILIVIAIIALLMQGGLASYRSFSRRQLIVNVTRQVEGDLRLAQQQSLANARPAGVVCNPPEKFAGIEFAVPTQTTYEIRALCTDGTKSVVKAATLPPNTNFVRSSDHEIVFLPLGEGTDISSTWRLGLCAYNQDSTSLEVSETGEIVEESYNRCSE